LRIDCDHDDRQPGEGVSTEVDLSLLVAPRSVALVGASENKMSIGGRALENLLDFSDFKGEIYPINPTRDTVRGLRAYPSISALPASVDLAVLAISAASVLEVLEECGAKGIKFAIVLSAGFGEVGQEGKQAEVRMREICTRTGMRIYGPNCPGLNNIKDRIGFSFSPAWRLDQLPGVIGVATQGGGLGRTCMQSMERGIGIGLWLSAGNEADLEVSDFIHHMAADPQIKVIATILEGVRDGAKFIAAARTAARHGKPIVVVKVGRSEEGAKAAASHTASIAGSAEVNEAVFRQLGIVLTDDVDELMDTAALFARRLPRGDEKAAIYADSGGSAALMADQLGLAGVEMAKFTSATAGNLAALLPSYASQVNPVDTTAEILARPELREQVLQVIADDANVDIVISPIPYEYGLATQNFADAVVAVGRKSDKLMLGVWMSDRLGEGYRTLVEGGIAPQRSVSRVGKILRNWIGWGRWWREQSWRDWNPPQWVCAQPPRRLTLTEDAAKRLLAEHGLRVPMGGVAKTERDALELASRIGYPVVAKISSADIIHKSDVGGVEVGLRDAGQLSQAWVRIHERVRSALPSARLEGLLVEQMAPVDGHEVVIGVHRDPVWGHVITFGIGGLLIELIRDVSRRLLPLTRQQAESMVGEIRCYPILAGYRGKPPADLDALYSLLLAVSDFVSVNHAAVEELELNPVRVATGGHGALVLDAVLVLNTPLRSAP